jgi:alternate signal-mediated exported protein, CPF_0494 family
MNRKRTISKTKKFLVTVSAMAVVGVIASSLAYWNQTHVIENPFETGGKYSSTVIEHFTPEEEWQPGVEVNKTVHIENTGEQDIIIRVKMDEKWVRKGMTTPYKELTASSDGAVYVTGQESNNDGLTENDNSVVIKNFSGSENWIDGGDGWFYYKTNLPKGEMTDSWLNSVELLDNLDIGVQKVLHYVTTEMELSEETKWELYDHTLGMPKTLEGKPVLHSKSTVVYEKDQEGNELIGYLDSEYTLTITTQTVQATKEAILATFELTDSQLDALEVTWKLADIK